MINNPSLWYVLKTKPKAEKQVSKQLTESGITSFLPLKRELRTWSDRKKWVSSPLFGNYIFVCTTAKQREGVFKAQGIMHYLTIGGKHAVLSEQELDHIKRICDSENEVIIQRGNLQVGVLVEIKSGPLIGLRGLLQYHEGRKIRIRLNGLECDAVVEIGQELVRIVEKGT